MIALSLLAAAPLVCQVEPTAADEGAYYRLLTYEPPPGATLEVGGIDLLPDGRPILSTRRGEIWVVDDAFTDDPADATFERVAEGLQEPLGVLVHDDGWIYSACRGELVRMRDSRSDGALETLDTFETVADDWPLSGNYHEYNFGPALAVDGSLWITTNKPFGAEPFGRAAWRGFALRIAPDGEVTPMCSGLRSPAGVRCAPWGELFYTDNQGEWCGASKLSLLEPGSFHGHPWGVFSCDDPAWPWPHPGTAPNRVPMPEVAERMPAFRLPAVWFPYDEMGRSPAGFDWDQSDGDFGPFAGQLFVVDQYAATVMRVALENVGGRWQGACFPFRKGLACGAVRCRFAPDGSLLIGLTDRGWASKGARSDGLQRLVWTGAVPFEMHAVEARSDGFRVTFTRPADPATLADPESWSCESYTYLLHEDYGSPEVDRAEPPIASATPAPDGLSVDLVVDGLRAGYVHELRAPGVRSDGGEPLLHGRAYYTLVRVPRPR